KEGPSSEVLTSEKSLPKSEPATETEKSNPASDNQEDTGPRVALSLQAIKSAVVEEETAETPGSDQPTQEAPAKPARRKADETSQNLPARVLPVRTVEEPVFADEPKSSDGELAAPQVIQTIEQEKNAALAETAPESETKVTIADLDEEPKGMNTVQVLGALLILALILIALYLGTSH
ncbi:MAG: hypothetical protein K2Z81_20975, partial [Cyanobacteria bacterium]|nr:hypothetical protein [Cyanobacteriota bacterium]